jgi:ankyrin repeat protein
MKIIEACGRGDITQLRRLGRQGIRVSSSGNILAGAIDNGTSLDVLRCLVQELGGDVNQAAFDGNTALFISAQYGDLAAVVCLVKELGADVNRCHESGWTLLHAATTGSHLAVMRCLVNDFGVNVNQARADGTTPLHIAAHNDDLAAVRCLVEELGADVNRARLNGSTPLMVASGYKHAALVKWLVKAGADPQATTHSPSITAADFSNHVGASFEQTAYLEAKTHCSNAGCSGSGLMKCTGCKRARYCGEACQLVHWKAHKADCKRWIAELKAGKES